ncbi:DUF956 domain-containing protein, partial [Lacticaseibacillus paracasei]
MSKKSFKMSLKGWRKMVQSINTKSELVVEGTAFMG